MEMKAVLKVRKQFILDPEKLRVVKKILDAKTDTEAVNKAMDMAISNVRLRKVFESARGKGKIKDIYGRTH
jgi:hypothetical protein